MNPHLLAADRFRRRAGHLPRTLLLALLLLGGGALADEDADASSDLASFVARVDALRTERAIPGLSFAVVRDGQVVIAAGLGVADLDSGTPATAETGYDIASVTKPTSAVVALRLVEEGVLDLDRPIAEYSDWVDFCTAFAERPLLFARDLRCDPATHTLRHLLSHMPVGTPGARFSYNPVLYSWASRPIMAATDTPFSTLVERYVFEPAGMTASARRHRALPLPPSAAARLAPPHRLDASGALVRAPDLAPQGDGAAGGVVSTVLDLARFDIALDAGRLLSEASRTEMLTPTPTLEGSPAPYGLGFYVQDHAGLRLVWHGGWWEQAYSALYLKIPERRLTFIALANSEGMWWGNPLDEATVERSPFAQAFFATFAPQAVPEAAAAMLGACPESVTIARVPGLQQVGGFWPTREDLAARGLSGRSVAELGITARLELELIVEPNGSVSEARVIETVVNVPEHDVDLDQLFDRKAVEMARASRFQPPDERCLLRHELTWEMPD